MRKNAELIKLARQYFISDAGLGMANLIRKIQIAEGHVDCYATGKTHCDQMNCRWRRDCLGAAGETNDPDSDKAADRDSGQQEECN